MAMGNHGIAFGPFTPWMGEGVGIPVPAVQRCQDSRLELGLEAMSFGQLLTFEAVVES